MDFDDQLRRYFGTADVGSITPEAMQAGIEQMLVDFGMEKDLRRRFAIWALLHIVGAAPDLDVAFESDADRAMARQLMELLEQTISQEVGEDEPRTRH
jgi:hypothetical protein